MFTRRHLIHASLAGCAGIAACSSETGPQSSAEPASASKAATETASAEPPRFDPADLKRRLDAGEDVYLLDVRTPKELEEEGAIDGYHHIPIDELEARLDEVPKGKPMVIYWRRGGRAARAAAILEKAGYNSEIEIGGITAWKEAGLPVVHPKMSGESETKSANP